MKQENNGGKDPVDKAFLECIPKSIIIARGKTM
jgi:hypothetical protein